MMINVFVFQNLTMAGSIARMNSDDSYDSRMSVDSGYGNSKNFDGDPQRVVETAKKLKELSLSDSKRVSQKQRHAITFYLHTLSKVIWHYFGLLIEQRVVGQQASLHLTKLSRSTLQYSTLLTDHEIYR